MTPEQFDAILADIATGEPTHKALHAHGANYKSFYGRLNTDAVARERYARAKQDGLERLADEILEIADDGTNDRATRTNAAGEVYEVTDQDVIARSRLRVDSRKWLLAKLMPKKYGEQLQVGGIPDGEPIRVSMTPTDAEL